MNIEKLEKSQSKATFDVTAEQFENALNKAFEKVNANVTIKGFRKGHAPRSTYEKNYGVESLYDEALNVIFNDCVAEIYKDENVARKVVGQFVPNIETKDFKRGKDFQVSLTWDTYPEVEIKQYKGLEVAKKVLDATDEEVNNAVNDLLKSKAKPELKAEQVIAKGDIAKFDFNGKVDGVEFDGGKATDYEMEIGSGQFIPGFEDQMIGMKKDETKDVVVTFPENYPAKNLAGKEAHFEVLVHEVKNNVLPELNDEFVKELKYENVNTVEELKAHEKTRIEESKKKSEHDRQLNELIDKVLDNAVVDMPQSLINETKENITRNYENQAKQYNIPFETYLQLMGTNKEDFEKSVEQNATRQTLFEVVLNKMIELEHLEPTQEELDKKAEEVASQTRQSKDDVLKTRVNQLFYQIVTDKFFNLLLDNAKEI